MTVAKRGPGIECAREPFELKPLAAEGYEAEFRHVGRAVGKNLFPLGQVGGGLAPLGEHWPTRPLNSWNLTRLVEGRLPLRVWDIDVTVPPNE